MIDSASVIESGKMITAAKAAEHETVLRKKPRDIGNWFFMTQLVGYYYANLDTVPNARQAWRKYVLWLVRHDPFGQFWSRPEVSLDPDTDRAAYRTAREIWLGRAAHADKSPIILANAGGFLFLHDRETAEELFRRAQEADPDNPVWHTLHGDRYFALSIRDGVADEKSARDALVCYERAWERWHEPWKPHVILKKLTVASLRSGDFHKADWYAAELIDAATRAQERTWAECGLALHVGNTVLGHSALSKNNVEEAERLLLKAGKAERWSDHYYPPAPSMLLARELLKKGRTETVIEYLRLCGESWEEQTTDAWIEQIKKGETPDFGRNLDY